MILGIDTAAGQCAVALVQRHTPTGALDEPRFVLRAARRAAMGRGHAEALWPMIDAVLSEAGASYGDLSRIAVCTGPGSFTGIRVGVAAARGLALGRGIPAAGIDRFDALLESHARGTGVPPPGTPIAVAIAGPRETAYLRIVEAGDAAGGRPGTDRQVLRAELDALAGFGALRLGDGWPGAAAEAGLPEPSAVARLAAALPQDVPFPPRPHYLRGHGADRPRHVAPPILDGTP